MRVPLERAHRIQRVDRVRLRLIWPGRPPLRIAVPPVVGLEHNVACARQRVDVRDVSLGRPVLARRDVPMVENDGRPAGRGLIARWDRQQRVLLQPLGEIGRDITVVIRAGGQALLDGDIASGKALPAQKGDRKAVWPVDRSGPVGYGAACRVGERGCLAMAGRRAGDAEEQCEAEQELRQPPMVAMGAGHELGVLDRVSRLTLLVMVEPGGQRMKLCVG